MIEFIRKQDAINALGEEPEVWYDDDYVIGARDEWVSNKLSIEALDRVDVKPFIRAKWIVEENMHGFLTCECSNCGEETRETVMGKPRFMFCPMCGAMMEYNDA